MPGWGHRGHSKRVHNISIPTCYTPFYQSRYCLLKHIPAKKKSKTGESPVGGKDCLLESIHVPHTVNYSVAKQPRLLPGPRLVIKWQIFQKIGTRIALNILREMIDEKREDVRNLLIPKKKKTPSPLVGVLKKTALSCTWYSASGGTWLNLTTFRNFNTSNQDLQISKYHYSSTRMLGVFQNRPNWWYERLFTNYMIQYTIVIKPLEQALTQDQEGKEKVVKLTFWIYIYIYKNISYISICYRLAAVTLSKVSHVSAMLLSESPLKIRVERGWALHLVVPPSLLAKPNCLLRVFKR